MLARRMKWTWQELRSQPKAFIDILVLMETLDAEKQSEDLAKSEAEAAAARAKAKARK